MNERNLKIAGVFAFVGAAQWILFVILAESLYPNYSVSRSFLSDLGASFGYPSAIIWNTTLSLLGLFSLASAYFFRLEVRKRRGFTLFYGLFGFGSLLAGVFPETFLIVHEVGSLIAFISGGIAAILAYRFTRLPVRYVSLTLGILVLAWLFPVLFSGAFSRITGGVLGAGLIERMLVYPILIWELVFGTYLMTIDTMADT